MIKFPQLYLDVRVVCGPTWVSPRHSGHECYVLSNTVTPWDIAWLCRDKRSVGTDSAFSSMRVSM